MQYIKGVGSHNPGDCAIQALTNCFQTPYNANLDLARRRFGYPCTSTGGVDFEAFNSYCILLAEQVHTFAGIRGALWVASRVPAEKIVRCNDSITLGQWFNNPVALKGHWILSLRGHVLAVVNGIICDSFTAGKKCRIIAAYKMRD